MFHGSSREKVRFKIQWISGISPGDFFPGIGNQNRRMNMRGIFWNRLIILTALVLLISGCDKDWLPAWMRSDDDDDNGKDVSGVEWITVEGGTFQMGDTYGVGRTNEYPVHDVTLSSYQIS